jgi:hypothetical protein
MPTAAIGVNASVALNVVPYGGRSSTAKARRVTTGSIHRARGMLRRFPGCHFPGGSGRERVACW